MRRWWYLFLVISIAACQSVDKKADRLQKISNELYLQNGIDSSLWLASDNLFRLNSSIDDNNLSKFDYFGGFYDNQLKVYYAKHVDQNINSAEVNFIALYFVDSLLAKVKYGLSENLTNVLIDSLGIPKTIKHSQENIKSFDKVAYTNQSLFRLNPEIKSYKLIWHYTRVKILMDVGQPPDPFLGMDNRYALNYQLSEYNDKISALYSL